MSFLSKLLSDSHWEKLEESKRSSKVVRVVMDNVLLLLANTFLALAIQYSDQSRIYIICTVASFLAYLLGVVYYAAFDDYLKTKSFKKENIVKELNNKIDNLNEQIWEKDIEINGCEEALSSIQAAIDLSAKNLNILRHDLMDDGQALEKSWNFPQICAVICNSAYNILNKMYKNDQGFEVSYISYNTLSNGNHVSKMICYENRNNEMPSIYNKEFILPKKLKKKSLRKRYCFERLLFEKTNAPLILLNENEIRNVFKFENDEQRNICKYKQYIGIPICCEAKKPIGLLQIVSFQNKLIPGDKNDVNRALITSLRPLSYLSLLANKTQDCINLIGGK